VVSVEDALPKGRSAVDVAGALRSAHEALAATGGVTGWKPPPCGSDAAGWKAGDFFAHPVVTGAPCRRPVRLNGVIGRGASLPVWRPLLSRRLNADLRVRHENPAASRSATAAGPRRDRCPVAETRKTVTILFIDATRPPPGERTD
jgi:hypothetical protein